MQRKDEVNKEGDKEKIRRLNNLIDDTKKLLPDFGYYLEE